MRTKGYCTCPVARTRSCACHDEALSDLLWYVEQLLPGVGSCFAETIADRDEEAIDWSDIMPSSDSLFSDHGLSDCGLVLEYESSMRITWHTPH